MALLQLAAHCRHLQSPEGTLQPLRWPLYPSVFCPPTLASSSTPCTSVSMILSSIYRLIAVDSFAHLVNCCELPTVQRALIHDWVPWTSDACFASSLALVCCLTFTLADPHLGCPYICCFWLKFTYSHVTSRAWSQPSPNKICERAWGRGESFKSLPIISSNLGKFPDT